MKLFVEDMPFSRRREIRKQLGDVGARIRRINKEILTLWNDREKMKNEETMLLEMLKELGGK